MKETVAYSKIADQHEQEHAKIGLPAISSRVDKVKSGGVKQGELAVGDAHDGSQR